MITSLNCRDSLFGGFNDGSLRYLDVSHVERLDGFNAPYFGYKTTQKKRISVHYLLGTSAIV